MKARLLRDARINHKAGEIVEVSPAEFGFLASVGSAVLVVDEQPTAETPDKAKRTTRKKG